MTNLRIHEWLHDLPADPKKTILTIQGVDQNSIKYISHDNTESNWVAPDGPLRVPECNLDLLNFGRSTGTSMDIFVRGVGVRLTQAKNLMTKNLKSAMETKELETEGKNAKKKHLSDEFLNLNLIYQTTIQTMSSSRAAISYSRNVRKLRLAWRCWHQDGLSNFQIVPSFVDNTLSSPPSLSSTFLSERGTLMTSDIFSSSRPRLGFSLSSDQHRLFSLSRTSTFNLKIYIGIPASGSKKVL